MDTLLKRVIDAHGGMKRWNELKSVTARLENGGVLWSLKGQPSFVQPSYVTARLHEQWASHAPFLTPGHRSSLQAHRVAIETLDGELVEERLNPRDSFAGHTMETPWDRLQLAYFAGYAMWTYLTTPFAFAMPGFEVREVASWSEGNETWRGLRVKFPSDIATHSTEQTFYFDKEGLLRRHDYDVEIAKGAKGAHYVYDHRTFDGIVVPTRRRVYVPGADNKPMPEPIIVSIDLSEIRFQ